MSLDDKARLARLMNKNALPYDDVMLTKWVDYVYLMQKWNHVMNLTAITAIDEMLSRHVVESLKVAPYVQGDSVIDVGTGAGLPGIPLAIALPKMHFCLLDSNQKRIVFLTQVVKQLGLENVVCQHSLVEEYQPDEKFSTILTRAFRPLKQMIEMTQHLLAPSGRFVAMIGKAPDHEALPAGYQLVDVIPMFQPECDNSRHLGIITKADRE